MEWSNEKPWFVAIGASGAHGLDDIKQLLHALPTATPAVVLLVLHRPWDRLSNLRAVLAPASRMPVVIAADGERFEAGMVYIGGPADHLTLAAKSFGALVADPDREYRNRTVDLLFHSVAEHGGRRSIGVILSGALDDGARGLADVHHAGGLTMVLTPLGGSPVGMPENAIAYGGAIDLTGNPLQIAQAIEAAINAQPPNRLPAAAARRPARNRSARRPPRPA